MKEKKTVTTAKAEANRKNAGKSTGPRTPRGKRYSRLNAVKHGLYCKELLVPEADKPEFEELRRHLKVQFRPASAVQQLAFEDVVTCAWRCKLALRLERYQFEAQLQASEPDQTEGGVKAVVDPHVSGWYGSSRLSVRAGIRALERASAEFSELGFFHGGTKEFLTLGFGPEFLETLSRWTPMRKEAILLANCLVGHQQQFGGDLYPDGVQPPEVVLDPQQGNEMVLKLLSERRHFLEELLKITDQNWSGGEGKETRQRPDFNPGFFAAANRELRRAVDWFLHICESGL